MQLTTIVAVLAIGAAAAPVTSPQSKSDVEKRQPSDSEITSRELEKRQLLGIGGVGGPVSLPDGDLPDNGLLSGVDGSREILDTSPSGSKITARELVERQLLGIGGEGGSVGLPDGGLLDSGLLNGVAGSREVSDISLLRE